MISSENLHVLSISCSSHQNYSVSRQLSLCSLCLFTYRPLPYYSLVAHNTLVLSSFCYPRHYIPRLMFYLLFIARSSYIPRSTLSLLVIFSILCSLFSFRSLISFALLYYSPLFYFRSFVALYYVYLLLALPYYSLVAHNISLVLDYFSPYRSLLAPLYLLSLVTMFLALLIGRFSLTLSSLYPFFLF